jgi:N-acetylglutamate synthase-like GNAT family acetyltransferase
MSQPEYRIRRATLDDIESLKELWASMNFDVPDLEKRLTEFQIAEDADGTLLGAIGFQIIKSHGQLHSEAFTDFSLADDLRALFWERFISLTTSRSVYRVWTRERSVFWNRLGFQPVDQEVLEKLPEVWDRTTDDWLTFPLKDDSAIAAIERQIALAMSAEKKRSEKTFGKVKTFKTLATIVGFLIAFAIFGAAIWLYLSNRR